MHAEGQVLSPDATRQIVFRETLGRGGFGTVYLADLKSSQGLFQRVAIKILNADGPEVAEVAARQRDEARLLALLNHDHIVKVYDLIEVDGRPAVLMEFVDGVDAEALVKRGGPLSPRAALQLCAGVASALDAAYNATSPISGRPLRAIHRDVKPANVLVGGSGSVKVLDFGVARADIDRDAKTQDGQMGTLAYMSPEQWLHGTVSPALDIFALGLTLLRLLTGTVIERIPLAPEKYRARVTELVASVHSDDWNPAWTAALHALLRDLLQFSPEARPDAAQVETRCHALAEGAPGESLMALARRTVPALVDDRRRRLATASTMLPGDITMGTATQPTAPTLAPVRPPPAPAPARRKPTSWGFVAAASLGGLALAVVAGVGGLILLLGEAPEEPVAAPIASSSAGPAVVNEVRRRESAAAPAATPTPAPEAKAVEAPTSRPAATSSRKTASAAPAAGEAPAASVASWPLTVSSVPMGAEVYVDGRKIGATPLRGAMIPEGDHTLKVVAGDGRSASKSIRVSERSPRQYIWRADGDSWESSI